MTFLKRRIFGNHLLLSSHSQTMSFSIYSRKTPKRNWLPKQLRINLEQKHIPTVSEKNTAPFMLKKQKGNHPELIYNEGNNNYLIQRFPGSHSCNVFRNWYMLRIACTKKNVKWSHIEGFGVLYKVTGPFKNDWSKSFVPQLQRPAQLLLNKPYLLETLWREANASVTTLCTS